MKRAGGYPNGVTGVEAIREMAWRRTIDRRTYVLRKIETRSPALYLPVGTAGRAMSALNRDFYRANLSLTARLS